MFLRRRKDEIETENEKKPLSYGLLKTLKLIFLCEVNANKKMLRGKHFSEVAQSSENFH